MSDFIQNIDNGMTSLNLLNSKLDSLKGSTSIANNPKYSEEEKKKIEQTSRSFESMFVNMMMKQMKEAQLEETDEEGEMNFGADTLKEYGDMLFGDYVSKSGKGIGLSELIYKHLTGDESFPTITNEFKQLDKIINVPLTQNSKHENIGINTKATDRISNLNNIIKIAANKFGVDENLIKAIITAESAGKINAKSEAGAKGLMQLMDGTAKDMGVNNVFDPFQNVMGGTKYISDMLEKYDNNLEFALAAYNAGPGNVDKYNGIPPFAETKNYVNKVKKYLEQYSSL